MDKKSFVVYFNIAEVLEELTDEQVGKLFRAMVDYAINGTLPEFTGILRMAWIPIRQTLERDAGKYMAMVEKRRIAGQKGGKASAEARRSKAVENTAVSKQTQASETNQADNVNVNVNVNDNDNDNVSVNDNEADPGHDDTHTLIHFGTLHNVELTRDQYQEIMSTYQNPKKLINKVSVWLPEAAHPVKDHFALVHRFALNDDWPKKPEPEKPPDEQPRDPERGPITGMPESTRKRLGMAR